MKIAISSGHGKYIRGASGSPVPPQLDEVDEARRVVNRVAELWKQNGVETYVFHDDTSHDQSTNLANICNHHNNSFGDHGHDLDISVHFNAYNGTANGTEVWYYSQQSLASTVSAAMAAAAGLVDRGDKYTGDLYFLNNTNEPALLLEVCFCDNTSDSNKYDDSFEELCVAIAESIAGITISDRPPIEPPERPERPPMQEEENKFVMTLQGYGDMEVNINGQHFLVGDRPGECPVINMTLECPVHGENLTVVINGQAFHGPFTDNQPPPNNKDNITATVWTDTSTAYAPFTGISDTELAVALPANVPDAMMRDRGVWVQGPTGKAVGKIRDKGPWMVDDDEYVFGNAEPVSVTCYINHEPLPRGPRKGQIPSNDAAIDISPGLARAIGIDGKGKVSWGFVEPEIA